MLFPPDGSGQQRSAVFQLGAAQLGSGRSSTRTSAIHLPFQRRNKERRSKTRRPQRSGLKVAAVEKAASAAGTAVWALNQERKQPL